MTNQTKNNSICLIQHLLKSIDCLSYRLKMKMIEHFFQSIMYQMFKYKTLIVNQWKKFFDVPIKDQEETCEQVIEMGRNNYATTGNLLDYDFSKHYKLIAIDLSKQI